MSLLLDALKKAADDKKKKDNPADDNHEDALHIEDNAESLELELDLPDEKQDDSKDEFPEVDEEVIQQNSRPVDDVRTDKEIPDKEPVTTELDTEAETSETQEDSPLEIEAVQDDPTEKTEQVAPTAESPGISVENVEAIPADQPEPKTEPEPEPEPEEPPVLENTDANSVSNQDKINQRIQTEQALSALINKSNQHSRRANLRRTITFSILIALIIIGSGLYFFIQMQTETQNLYIAKNNTAVVDRALTKQVPTQTARPDNNTQAAAKPVIKTEPVAATPVVAKTVAKHSNSQKAAPATGAKQAPITIIHSSKQDPVDRLLRDAYNAFHKQDYIKSQNLYEKVLSREPKNRDAILGVAAIAIKQKQYEFARQKYQSLIRLNPKDSLAIAGLSSIKQHVDPSLNESQIKFLIKEKPDSAPLYFALGSLYATQNRWPEAQSAYFSAWSAENKNADYCYNLAVSLDHIGKSDQALQFYQLSLKLKQASSGNFSIESTQQRIDSLQGNKQ